MAVQIQHLGWNDPCPIIDSAASAKERGASLLLSPTPDAVSQDLIEASLRQHSSADIIVFVDPRRPARKPRRRELLPPIISLIAASPEHDRAVLISAKALPKGESFGHLQTWREFVVTLAALTSVAFVEVSTDQQQTLQEKPSLTAPGTPPQARWLRHLIPRISVPDATPKTLIAVQAGLFLLADLFDESHSCSQSLEGEGRFHTGDYWHAILHRREPDYGNSKYWFRHVGRHPIFAELPSSVSELHPPTTKSAQFQSQVVSSGAWDPFGFVDLCAAAEENRELNGWCAAIQYEEMLLLLEHSYREAAGIA